jgi:hypothetical protein
MGISSKLSSPLAMLIYNSDGFIGFLPRGNGVYRPGNSFQAERKCTWLAGAAPA